MQATYSYLYRIVKVAESDPAPGTHRDQCAALLLLCIGHCVQQAQPSSESELAVRCSCLKLVTWPHTDLSYLSQLGSALGLAAAQKVVPAQTLATMDDSRLNPEMQYPGGARLYVCCCR